MRANPYVGPRSFQQGEHLYGRDTEIADLVDLLISERIVLLHSPSGAGKSSLIQAALLPALAAEDFHCLGTGRVGQALEGETHNPYVDALIMSLEAQNPQPFNTEALIGTTITDYLLRRIEALDDQQSPLIVIDQFEEVLTLHPADTIQKREFFLQLGKALTDLEIWCLLAMREDFLAGLVPFRDLLPTRLDIAYQLTLLTKHGALAAIRKPAALAGVDFRESAACMLIDSLSEVRVQQPDGATVIAQGDHVEPVQLQVVCRNLWASLPEDRHHVDDQDISAVADVDQALRTYYADSIEVIAVLSNVGEHAIRDWCERHLITENELRGQVLRQEDQLPGEAVDGLIDAHLIRVERRHGAAWLELAHDRLVQPVLVDNREWRERNLSLLQHQAALWDQQGRSSELLIKGRALIQAEREARDTQPTDVETDFLKRSRRLKRTKRLRNLFLILFLTLNLAATYFYFDSLRKEEVVQGQQQQLNEQDRTLAERTRNLETTTEALAERNRELDERNRDIAASSAELATKQQELRDLETQLEETEQRDAARQAALTQRLTELQEEIALGQATSERAQREAADARARSDAARQTLADAQQRLATTQTRIRALDLASRVTGLVQSEPYLAGYIALEAYALQTELDGAVSPEVDSALRSVLDAFENAASPVITRESNAISALSGRGELLAWATRPGQLVLWNTQSEREITRRQLDHPVRGLAWSSDGQKLAVGYQNAGVALFDRTGRLMRRLTAEPRTRYALAFSDDGRTLYTGAKDGMLETWRLDQSTADSKSIGNADIRVLAAGPLHLAVGSDQLVLISFDTGQINTPSDIQDVRSLTWREGRLAVGTARQGVFVLNPDRPEEPRNFNVARAIVTGVHFTDGGLITAWSDGVLRIWDRLNDVAPREILGQGRALQRMVTAGRPAAVFTSSADQTIRRWSVDTQSVLDALCPALQDATPQATWRTQFPDLGRYRRICPLPPIPGDTP